MCLGPIFLLRLRRSCLRGLCPQRLRILSGGPVFLLQGALCLLLSGVLLGVPSFSGCCLFRGAGPSVSGLRRAAGLCRLAFGVVFVA